MANDDIALVVRNSEEKIASTDSNPKMTTENSGSQDEQMESFLRKYWKKMFIASCLLAVLLDPLFLYIPMFEDKDDMKCLRMDRTLKITTVILRSITDLFSIMDIIYQIYTSKELRDRTGSLRFSLSILIDILAILPFPQVMILIFFSKMRRSSGIINLMVLSQYAPRVLRIYLSFKELQLTRETEETSAWIKGLLNFFMYILASHVVGAVWYFFAIQRMTVCWQSGCGSKKGCETSRSFGCHEITFLNDLCPISPSNSTIFDFGLYKSVFESGIYASTDNFQKFSNCFWWGLRNLSSLGSNLEPSVNGWENLFAAFISIMGLLLFLYLIGNVQIYMQLDRGRREDRRHKLKVDKRMKEKIGEVERWLAKTGIPERLNNDIKFHIIEKVRQEVEDDRDVNLDHIFYTLPWDHQNRIKSCSPLTRLKKVPMLETMDESDLKAMCDNFKRKKYTKDEIIIHVGEPLQMMLFIVDGSVVPEKGYSNLPLGAGELYGERVIYFILRLHFPEHDTALLATDSLRATGDVEALVLMASDMASALSKFVSQFRRDYKFRELLDKHLAQGRTLGKFTKEEFLKEKTREVERWLATSGIPERFKNDIKFRIIEKVREEVEDDRDVHLEHIFYTLPWDHQNRIKSCSPLTRLKKVPMLETMDESDLKAMCDNFEPKKYTQDEIIIHVGKPLEMMLFIVDGSVVPENGYSKMPLGAGDLYGEGVIYLILRSHFPEHNTVLLATDSVRAAGDVEALVLMASDMKSALSKFVSQFRGDYKFREQLDKHLAQAQARCLAGTLLKKVPMLEAMDESDLKAMCDNFKPKKYTKDEIIIHVGKPLEMMLFIVDGYVVPENGYSKMPLGAGDLYGEGVIYLILRSHFPEHHTVLLATDSVRATGDVEALVLMASDMRSALSRFVSPFRGNDKFREQLDMHLAQARLAGTILKKVPMLEAMDESDLKAMCDNFEPKKYTQDEIIIHVGKPLEMMLFIVDGYVVPENGYSKMPLGAGELYGETVIYLILRSHFPERNTVLLATDSVRAAGDVEALVLMASDMKSALSKFVSQFRGDYKFREQLDKHLAQARTLGTFTEEEFLLYGIERIATGAHSLMYRVVSDDGRATHALKVYQWKIDRRDHEVAVLSLISHENVVKLEGMIKDYFDLVFEYAGRRCCEQEMSFKERMVVALDISAALAYLHSSIGKPVVIHQNVNLEHILLDDRDHQCTAKLSGFGSSEVLPRGQTQIQNTEVVQGNGMIGYVDPEFIESKILTEKVDVYSFGVVLVELLMLREACFSDKHVVERNLATFLSAMEKDGFAEIADHIAIEKGHIEFEAAEKVAFLAKKCLACKGNERPTMQEVHMELKKVTKAVWPRLRRR